MLLNNLCGMLVGMAIITAMPEAVGTHRRLVLATCTLGNVGQIPLALADAACTDGLDKFASRIGDCKVDAQAMVGFGISVGSLAVWTLAPILLRPDGTAQVGAPGSSAAAADEEKALAYAPLTDDGAERGNATDPPAVRHKSPVTGGEEASHARGGAPSTIPAQIHRGWPHSGPGVCAVCVRAKRAGGGGKSLGVAGSGDSDRGM